MDRVIERARLALQSGGLPEPGPPADADLLQAVGDAISPLRLPPDLRRLHEILDPARLGVAAHPAGASLRFALDTWLQHRDGYPGMVPEVLFPLCYESWSFLFVELDTGEQSGGRVFGWMYGGSHHTLRFATVRDWLDVLAEALEQGAFTRTGTAARVDQSVYEHLAAQRMGARTLVVSEAEEGWPEHWHARSADPDADARGTTHTIRELLDSSPAEATVAGAFSRVLHIPNVGERIALVDGSGVLDLWCPSDLARFPALATADYMEFDVTTRLSAGDWRPPPRPVAPRSRGHSRNYPRITYVDELHRTPPQAIAQAIRRAHPPYDRPQRWQAS